MSDLRPLFTIAVLSYNSSKTIIETLDSIRNQSYSRIELIVSDDASSDDTLIIVREWLEINRDRFENVQIISQSYNTGIAANALRAINASHGLWRKGIAADDILLPHALEMVMDFVDAHPDVSWIQGKALYYKENFRDEYLDQKSTDALYVDSYKKLFDLSANEQLIKIVHGNFIIAPAAFIKTEIEKKYITEGEKYKYCDDFAFNIKLLSNDVKLFFFDEYLVGYRVSLSSISNKGVSTLFNINYKRSLHDVQKDFCYPYLSRKEIKRTEKIFKWESFVDSIGLNKNNIFNTIVYRIGVLFCKLISI